MVRIDVIGGQHLSWRWRLIQLSSQCRRANLLYLRGVNIVLWGRPTYRLGLKLYRPILKRATKNFNRFCYNICRIYTHNILNLKPTNNKYNITSLLLYNNTKCVNYICICIMLLNFVNYSCKLVLVFVFYNFLFYKIKNVFCTRFVRFVIDDWISGYV